MKIDDCDTTKYFWDCECYNENDEKFEYIKERAIKYCTKCKCIQYDQPNSRIKEVIEMLIYKENKGIL